MLALVVLLIKAVLCFSVGWLGIRYFLGESFCYKKKVIQLSFTIVQLCHVSRFRWTFKKNRRVG